MTGRGQAWNILEGGHSRERSGLTQKAQGSRHPVGKADCGDSAGVGGREWGTEQTELRLWRGSRQKLLSKQGRPEIRSGILGMRLCHM